MQIRISARVILVDCEDRVLPFRVQERGVDDPMREPGTEAVDRVFWITPGGGVEAGESIEEAADRELFEETGLSVPHLGDPVYYREKTLANPTGRVSSKEHFFLVRLESEADVSTAGHTELELRDLGGHHWWSLDELEQTREIVYPEGFASVVRAPLAG